MPKVVVRLGYNAPELGVLLSEGAKTLMVVPLYGLTLEQAIVDAPNRKTGERWVRTSCVLLNPDTDSEKIEAVKRLLREDRALREKIGQMQDEFRAAYKARVAEVFGPGRS